MKRAACSIFAILLLATSVHAENPCYPGRTCPCDYDDGTGTGTPDGGCTIDDILYYFSLFEQGSPCADEDDGSFTGTADGGVTIEDFLYFAFRSKLELTSC